MVAGWFQEVPRVFILHFAFCIQYFAILSSSLWHAAGRLEMGPQRGLQNTECKMQNGRNDW
jgi:hypothetical protein